MNKCTNRLIDTQEQLSNSSIQDESCVRSACFSRIGTNKNGAYIAVNAVPENQTSYVPAPTGDMKECNDAQNNAELNANPFSVALIVLSKPIAKLKENRLTKPKRKIN